MGDGVRLYAYRGDIMFRIVICDNEKDELNRYREMIQQFLRKKLKQYEIQCFVSSEEVLKTELEQVDVFFLNVELESSRGGIQLAEKIRVKNQSAFLMFYSNSSDFAYDVIQVDTFRYFLKPIQKELLISALDIILQKRKELVSKLVILQKGRKFYRIPYYEIIYFETQERKLHTVTVKKEYMVDNKINELEKQVEDFSFFRIHKSYLINLAFVKEYDQESVTMMNGDVLFISHLRLKEFKQKYMNYVEESIP